MIKTTLRIDGMMCGMCEAHVNDAVRAAFRVHKVTSSHSAGTTEILSDEALDEAKLKETIGATGYTLVSIEAEEYTQKKGFSLFHKK